VVVIAGGLGLAVAERGKTTYAEAAHTVKLVDTHGAGDAFIGALAARWASGVPIAEVVRFANAAAALFVSTPADQKNAEQKTNNFCLLPSAFSAWTPRRR
jgi:ribokinase